jgi:hypothetical protein
VGRADDVADQVALRHDEAEHLAFDGARGDWVRTNLAGRYLLGRYLSGPGSGAVDDLCGVECGLSCDHAGGAAAGYCDGCDFVAGGKIYAAMLGCFPRSRHQSAGIDTALFQIHR